VGGSGPIGTKVRESSKGKAPVSGGNAAPVNFHHLDDSTMLEQYVFNITS